MNKMKLLKSFATAVMFFVFYFVGYYAVSRDIDETLANWPVATSISVIIVFITYKKQNE